MRCLTIAVVPLLAGCFSQNEQRGPSPKTPLTTAERQTTEPLIASKPEKLKADHLPNPVRVHPNVISGGLPEGDLAFAELRSLGIRTIISVDGAKPDVATAAKYGLKYVHLPHGYDGISDARVRELAKAVRDLDGPIYIHCHHGKHRSPVAASAACVTAGLLPPANSLSILELAGTSPNYKGLYQSVGAAKPLSAAELDNLRVVFHETVDVTPMAEAMVALEHAHDRIKKLVATGWKPPADHPDIDPAHEALLLREHFVELLRLEEVRSQSEAFVAVLRESEAAAGELEKGLRELKHPPNAESLGSLAKRTQRITANCKKCHERFRDIPLGEK